MNIPVQVDTHAWLPTSALTPEKLDRLRELLTLRRKAGRPGDPTEEVALYAERFGAIGLPRAYFERHRRDEHAVTNLTSAGEPWRGSSAFNGELFDVQVRAHDTVVGHASTNFGGLLEAAPAFGKTVTTCAIMATLRRRTMVLVHKEFLARQWRKRIAHFLPGVKIGLIQGTTADTEADVVMAMVQTLTSREWPEGFFNQFGLLVGDEVHRVAADSWMPAASMVPAMYRLGLSATFRRKDGCERVFFDHIGPVIFSHKTSRLTPTIFRVPAACGSDFRAASDRTKQVSILVKDKARCDQISDFTVQACEKGRKVMVLSERIPHLQALSKLLPAKWSRDFYIGGKTEAQLEEAEKAQVVYATRQLVEEGLDIPALDTLIYATPLVDPEQSVGRILRPHPGKLPPVVVDLRDNTSMLQAFSRKRDQWYAELGWLGTPAP